MTGEVSSRITDRMTDSHDNYRNPRCACAPRVNKGEEGEEVVGYMYVRRLLYIYLSE